MHELGAWECRVYKCIVTPTQALSSALSTNGPPNARQQANATSFRMAFRHAGTFAEVKLLYRDMALRCVCARVCIVPSAFVC
jgi:hypothetical protein